VSTKIIICCTATKTVHFRDHNRQEDLMSNGKFLTTALATMTLLGGMAVSAQGPKPSLPAKEPAPAQLPADKQAAAELTSADLDAFFDGIMPAQLRRGDIAGAVVAVVKDGKVIFAEGYGYADVEARKPVSADDTLFRPGSISKLFTWTAVMQLVQEGKLDLDRDVNDYLDFKIPPTYPQPITLRNIMTHTSGFSETIKDLFVKDAGEMKPLGVYLANHVPERIFPPGTTPAYSNYATTIAGYIVQRVSGKPFNEYIETNIFQPLGMSHTTFEQPLPPSLKPLMSNGYAQASEKAKPFEFVQAWPAGSVSTSAMDMTHFMIAHLQNGEYNGARILRPETAQLMHARQFGSNPATNAMCLGFYEETRNGHRIIGHGGDTGWFHSDLHLILDSGVGFFVSYNSAGKGGVSNRTELFEQFLDRYFPYQVPAAKAPASAVADAKAVSGLYIVSRRLQGNWLEALGMLEEARVSALPDGKITVDELKGFNGQPKKFSEIGPLVYREVDGQDKVAFKRNQNGGFQFAIDYPFMVFDHVGVLQNKVLNLCILGFSLGIMALALVFWPINGWLRRHYRKRLNLSAGERRLRTLTRFVCAINILFVLLLAVVLASGDGITSFNHVGTKMHAIQIIGVLGSLGALVVVYNALRSWRWRPAPMESSIAAASADSGSTTSSSPSISSGTARQELRPSRILEALIALGCLGFVWFLLYWNVLNFSMHF
jgi:CubicO group peptidase (beta-lactamase class C family)